MPFQGNKSTPSDPSALIGLLLNHQRNLMQQKQAAQESAARQAIAQEKANRERETHKMDMLAKALSMRGDLASQTEAASSTAAENTPREASKIVSMEKGSSVDAQLSAALEATDSNSAFGKIVQSIDPKFAQPGAQDAAAADIANLAYSRSAESAFAPVRDTVGRISDATGVPQEVIAGQAGLELKSQEIERERELAKKLEQERRDLVKQKAQEMRDEAKSTRLADRAAERAADAPGNVTASLNRQIEDHLSMAANAKTDREKRIHERTVESLISQREAIGLESLSDMGVAERGRIPRLKNEYRELHSMVRVLESAKDQPEILGTNASLYKIYEHVTGLVGDLGRFVSSDLAKNADLYTQRELEQLETLFAGVDPNGNLGERISERRLEEIRAAWFILRGANESGRIAKAQIETLIDLSSADGILTPSNVGISNLGATLNILKRQERAKRAQLKNDYGVGFDEDGYFLGEDRPEPIGLENSDTPPPPGGEGATGGGDEDPTSSTLRPLPLDTDSGSSTGLTPEARARIASEVFN